MLPLSCSNISKTFSGLNQILDPRFLMCIQNFGPHCIFTFICFMLAGTLFLKKREKRFPQTFLPDAGRHVAFRADPPSLAGVASQAEMNTFQCDFLVTHLTHVGSKQPL